MQTRVYKQRQTVKRPEAETEELSVAAASLSDTSDATDLLTAIDRLLEG